jgi:hypothetical protein
LHETEKQIELFSPSETDPQMMGGTEVTDWTLTRHRLLKWREQRMTGRAHLSGKHAEKFPKKKVGGREDSNSDLLHRDIGLRPVC